MNRALFRVAAGFVTATALGFSGVVTALADDSTAPVYSLLVSRVNLSVVPDASSTIDRQTNGVQFELETTIPSQVAPAGTTVRVDAVVFNQPGQCGTGGAPYAPCGPAQLGAGIGDPHVLGPVAWGSVDSDGQVEIEGSIPAGAGLSNPLGAEVLLVIRVFNPACSANPGPTCPLYPSVEMVFHNPPAGSGDFQNNQQ